MAKNHYSTKPKRRNRSGKRKDSRRIAANMAKIRDLERKSSRTSYLDGVGQEPSKTSSHPIAAGESTEFLIQMGLFTPPFVAQDRRCSHKQHQNRRVLLCQARRQYHRRIRVDDR